MASRRALSLLKAARQRDVSAQLELGMCYLFGREKLAPNQLSAYHWLHEAANGEDSKMAADAVRLIGENINPSQFDKWRSGIDENPALDKSIAAVYPWHHAAAEAGSLAAQTALACHLLQRGHDAAALSQAEQHLYAAARQGHLPACLAWSRHILPGKGVGDAATSARRSGKMRAMAKSEALLECASWLEEAYAVGEQESAGMLANIFWILGSAELWRAGDDFSSTTDSAADDGSLARVEGRAADYRRRALLWHKIAWPRLSKDMVAETMYQRGCLLIWQAGAPPDQGEQYGESTDDDMTRQRRQCKTEALKWLQGAADRSHARAAYILGICAMGALPMPGSPFPRRYKQANRWLEMAIKLSMPGEQDESADSTDNAAGNPGAEANYALHFLHSRYCFAARKSKVRYTALQQAASLGHPVAQVEYADKLWRVAAKAANSRTDRGQSATIMELEALRLWFGVAQANHKLARDRATARWLANTSVGAACLNAGQRQAVGNLAAQQPDLALRLELGLAFGLKMHEFLCLEPQQADCGELLCVDVSASYGKASRRWVRIEHPWQRQILQRAQLELPGKVANGKFRNHKLRFLRWARKCGVETTVYAARHRH